MQDKMRKILVLAALCCRLAFSQVPAQAVNQTTGAPPFGVVQLFFYSGANVAYICNAAASANQTVFSISGTPGLTNITVSSNVGTINLPATARFWVGQQIAVTGSTTAVLNGPYRINTVSGMTATIATSGVSDGTYNNAAMTVVTSQPLLNALLWSIEVFTYAGSNVTGIYWAGTASGGTITQNLACSNGASY